MAEGLLNLYEVIRWGNDSDDPDTGGPNGPDTCFLVRADTVESAAELADAVLVGMPSEFVQGWSHAAYLLGADGGNDPKPQVLRGPYIQHAFGYGWRIWHRNDRNGEWSEVESEPRRRHKHAEPDAAPE